MTAAEPLPVRVAIAVVGALIRVAAPRDVARFRDDMRQAFADDVRAEHRSGGCRAVVGVSLAAAADIVATAARGRRDTPSLPTDHTRKDPLMRSLWSDVRYALRIYRRQPGFALAALATLALGIGANSAIFTILDAALIRPLPYPHADRLVQLWGVGESDDRQNVNPRDVLDWRHDSEAFDAVGIWSGSTQALTGAGDPITVRVVFATSGVFETLGATAAMGRLLGPEHDVPGRQKDVVITDGFWRRVLGGDRSAIGRTIVLSDVACTIVGVLPPGFVSPGIASGVEPDVWRPFVIALDSDRGGHYAKAIGRLKPAVALPAAQSKLDAVTARLAREFPSTNRGHGVRLEPLGRAISGDVRPALVVLAAAVGVVLLIACANVANLLLARAAARQREMAVRGALGASRARVVRQLLTESLLLSVLAGTLGTALGAVAIRALPAWLSDQIPSVLATHVDARVLVATATLSLATAIVFGLVPALHATRTDLRGTLSAGGRTGTGGVRRVQAVLLVLETALAVTLLASAGLLLKSYARLQRVIPGFDVEHVVTFRVSLPAARYTTADRKVQLFEQLIEGLGRIPGASAAGGVNMAPITNRYSCDSFGLDDRPAPPAGAEPCAESRVASRGYFRAMNIPVIAGRGFAASDSKTGAPVVVISQAMARRYWPDGNALGQRFKWGSVSAESPWRTVVGIVGDVRFFGQEANSPEEVYMPIEQAPGGSLTLAVRTSADPSSVVPQIRDVVRALDERLPLTEIFTTGELLKRSTAMRRFGTTVLVAFAALALGLAIVGIYGVMSFFVAERSHEIGVRIALGASPREVRWLVVRRGMAAAGLGAALGLGAAAVVTRLMTDLLFAVRPGDAAAFTGAPLVLLATAFVASYLPARAATRLDPLAAMRRE